MSKTLEQDLELVDKAMDRFLQSLSRPRAWDHMSARAGISVDRASAVMLQFLNQSEQQHCHLSDLAHKLGIEAPSVTRKVQQLEREGLVVRVIDPADKRASVLKTTVRGRQIVERLHKAKHELFSEVLQDWPAEDRTAFAHLFSKLAEDMATLIQDQSHKQPIVRITRKES